MKLSTIAGLVMGMLLFADPGAAGAKTVVTVKVKVTRSDVDVDRGTAGAAIRAVPGVVNVRFDALGKLPLAQGSIAEVTYDADVTHYNSIVNAVRNAGFTADGIVPDRPAAPIKKKT